MIIQFSITNYGCFRDRQTFSMLASHDVTQAPEAVSTVSLPGLKDESLLKGAVIFGGNATGKSTFFQALLQLRNMVFLSDRHPGDFPERIQFALNEKSMSESTRFELDFLVVGKRYSYNVAFTTRHIVEESLTAFPGKRPQKWYHRKYIDKKADYDWSFSQSFDQSDPKLKDRTQDGMLFLSVGGVWNHPQLKHIFQWFTSNVFFCSVKKADYPDLTLPLLDNLKFKKEILSLLAWADPGIVDVDVMREDVNTIPKNRTPQIVDAAFRVNGETGSNYLLPHDKMSDGTNRYASLLGLFLIVLKNGMVVLVDELETSLHPMLLYKLIGLFMSEKTNPKGAQLIFSTHMSSLFSASADPFGDVPLLRRDQFWFTEKSHDGSSSLYPLTRYQTQENEALERRYLAGRYGGIPMIPEGDIS